MCTRASLALDGRVDALFSVLVNTAEVTCDKQWSFTEVLAGNNYAMMWAAEASDTCAGHKQELVVRNQLILPLDNNLHAPYCLVTCLPFTHTNKKQ